MESLAICIFDLGLQKEYGMSEASFLSMHFFLLQYLVDFAIEDLDIFLVDLGL